MATTDTPVRFARRLTDDEREQLLGHIRAATGFEAGYRALIGFYRIAGATDCTRCGQPLAWGDGLHHPGGVEADHDPDLPAIDYATWQIHPDDNTAVYEALFAVDKADENPWGPWFNSGPSTYEPEEHRPC